MNRKISLSWDPWWHTFPWKLESYLSSVLSKLRTLVTVWKTPATIHWHQDCLKFLLSGRTTSIVMSTTSWYWLVRKFVCKSNLVAKWEHRDVLQIGNSTYICIYIYMCVYLNASTVCAYPRTIARYVMSCCDHDFNCILYILPPSSYLTSIASILHLLSHAVSL